MIVIVLSILKPKFYIATARIGRRTECCRGESKYAALGGLVRAFPETFLLGTVQRSMHLEDLGRLIFKTPRSFDIAIGDISE